MFIYKVEMLTLPSVTANKILEDFRPFTEMLDMGTNPNFGFEGLKCFVEGITSKKQPLSELRTLNSHFCGLGGTVERSSSLIFRLVCFVWY